MSIGPLMTLVPSTALMVTRSSGDALVLIAWKVTLELSTTLWESVRTVAPVALGDAVKATLVTMPSAFKPTTDETAHRRL